MVQYKHIIQAIEDDLTKSHQHLKLRNATKKTFNKFHKDTCGETPEDIEFAIFTDNNGKTHHSVRGDETQFRFQWDDIRAIYEKYGELNIDHNHPREGKSRICAECLSEKDIELVFAQLEDYDTGVYFYPIKSISCESGNGSRMTLTRGDKFSPPNIYEIRKIYPKLIENWRAYYKEYYSTGGEIYQKGLKEGRITNDMSNEERVEYIHKETIKEIGLFEQSKEFKNIQKEFRDLDCKLVYEFPQEYQVKPAGM